MYKRFNKASRASVTHRKLNVYTYVCESIANYKYICIYGSPHTHTHWTIFSSARKQNSKYCVAQTSKSYNYIGLCNMDIDNSQWVKLQQSFRRGYNLLLDLNSTDASKPCWQWDICISIWFYIFPTANGYATKSQFNLSFKDEKGIQFSLVNTHTLHRCESTHTYVYIGSNGLFIGHIEVSVSFFYATIVCWEVSILKLETFRC